MFKFTILCTIVAALGAVARPALYDFEERQMSNDTMSNSTMSGSMNDTMSGGGMMGGMMGNMSMPTDTQILQYALTLEHLEATF